MKRFGTVCVKAAPGDLATGLFGGVLNNIFEILPYLKSNGIFPQWSIASKLYGDAPDYLIIPGFLDLAYSPQPGSPRKILPLYRTRALKGHFIGSDWHATHALWSEYFRVPARVRERVASLGNLSRTLGIHYRGNDKTGAKWDTNAVGYGDFIAIVEDFLGRRPDLTQVLVATDENAFLSYARDHVDLPVISSGAGAFHLQRSTTASAPLKEADRALADCVALSLCAAVLNTSSALSAFAKVLNPELEIYRCAASKMFSDNPYFPIAYIPVYRPANPAIVALFERTMQGDWRDDPHARRFREPFAFKRRNPIRVGLRKLRFWMRARLTAWRRPAVAHEP